MFSDSYYRQVLAEFGYTPFDLQRFDFALAGLDSASLNVPVTTPAPCSTCTHAACTPVQPGNGPSRSSRST